MQHNDWIIKCIVDWRGEERLSKYVGTNVKPICLGQKEGYLGSKDKCWAGTSLNMYSINDAVL